MSSASASPELEEEPYVDRKPRWATERQLLLSIASDTQPPRRLVTFAPPANSRSPSATRKITSSYCTPDGAPSGLRSRRAVYASKKRADPAAFHLTYDGQRVDLTGRTTVGDSLEDEELEEGVVVDVVLAQVGGGVRGLGGETICDS
ncbi:uncharacterized protein EHS24_004185 [Apiotrichum porosum]|uniref:Ubiquitin-like domain-containing protein n=1 Tax=Apiotrichum porosum TaxID=105984 RepID=A0A427Y4K4_9TREE|nr:uncharacterized protein EHS24_004185 [Apiotrichum porosum]RSH85997.1 hypothetical protein EHS24_004185 [Apiotrichum porosum]